MMNDVRFHQLKNKPKECRNKVTDKGGLYNEESLEIGIL